MKNIKQTVYKRVIAYMLCTVLLSSTVFLSYENTMIVYAVDESDLVYDAVIAALAAIGVFASGGTVGALVLAIAPALAASGYDIYHYVTQDAETGKTTISEDFINLVLQAYKDYKEENAEKFDGTMLPNENGYYHYDSVSMVSFFSPMHSSNSSTIYTDIDTLYPMAIVVYSNRPDYNNRNGKICYGHVVFYNKDEDKFYSNGINKTNIAYGEDVYLTDFEQTIYGYGYLKKVHFVLHNTTTGETSSGEDYIGLAGSLGALPPTASLTVNSSNVPIYYNLSSLKEGLRSGDFSTAWNYGKVPECETPSYTGEYTGGDITIDTELLEGIRDKIEELEGTNKSIEELLKELLKWLKLKGGGSGDDSSGAGNVTVNIDLSTTNNWLSKIYSKVSQIYDKISSSVGQSMDEVVESIENLKQILKTYLSEITGDLDDIKGQLEEMSEQEFTEKTGDFLDDTLADFSEIGEKAKGKFPFSIPNDIRLLISKMSVSQQEYPDQGTYSVQTMSFDADQVSNGLVSVMDEDGGDTPVLSETGTPIRLLISKMSVSQPEESGSGRYSVQTMSFDADQESNGLISVMDEGGGGAPVLSETGAPIFYIPFVIASAGIDQYVVIDLSGFESISSFCRSLMTIFFILCLFNLTFKVMGLWGDLVD